jgi:hypothetical protein
VLEAGGALVELAKAFDNVAATLQRAGYVIGVGIFFLSESLSGFQATLDSCAMRFYQLWYSHYVD